MKIEKKLESRVTRRLLTENQARAVIDAEHTGGRETVWALYTLTGQGLVTNFCQRHTIAGLSGLKRILAAKLHRADAPVCVRDQPVFRLPRQEFIKIADDLGMQRIIPTVNRDPPRPRILESPAASIRTHIGSGVAPF